MPQVGQWPPCPDIKPCVLVHMRPLTPQALRHRDLAEAVGRFHRVWLRLGVPAAAAKLLAGQMAEELLLTGQCVLPRQLEDEGFDFHFPTVTEALKDLARR